MGEPNSVSPVTFEEEMNNQLAGKPMSGNYGIGQPGGLGKAVRLEVLRRRGLIQRDGGFAPLEADAADLALRDLQTGRVRRARQGSTNSALGSFSVNSALGADSLLGG